MAIFNNSNNTGSSNRKTGSNTTIITEGATFKGELSLHCDIYIDGLFEGTIESQKVVTVGKNGEIKGDVHAGHLVVQGNVEGTVDAERVEIKGSGRIRGTVVSSEMTIEEKGLFEGESRIKKNTLQLTARPAAEEEAEV